MDAALPPGETEHGPMAAWPTGRLLSTAARLIERAWIDALDERGLSHAGFIALHIIGDSPTNQTDLAARAHVENQTMSRTLDRLEREGYITRERDTRDRRRHIITRTPAGAAVWNLARTLEAEVFPQTADSQALREALLELIAASTVSRRQP